jgi:Bacterial regulatory proteins, gntR family
MILVQWFDREVNMLKKSVVTRIALTDQVTAILQERIFDRAYEPGEKLNIDALGREFDVSSSPIREALTRLSALPRDFDVVCWLFSDASSRPTLVRAASRLPDHR